MTVGPLRPAELPPLCRRLAAVPLLARYGYTAASLQARLDAAAVRGDQVVGCADGAGPCGVAWFARDGTLGVGGYLRLLAVAADAQGRGAGRALLAAFETSVARVSRHAFLLVSDFNLEAQRFYAHHGWRQVGALPALVRPDVDELLYWKRLVDAAG